MEKIIKNVLSKNNLTSLIALEEIMIISGKKIKQDNPFILLNGYVDIIYKETKHKDILHRIHPLDLHLCNISAVLSLNPRIIKFSFSKDSIVGVINSCKIKELSKKPNFLKNLYLNSSKFIFEKLRDEEFMRKLNGEEKLSYYLLKYSKDNQYKVDNYSNFAKVLKTDRNYIYKIIWKLEEKNLIEKKKNTIIIKNRKTLEKFYTSFL